MSGRAGELGFDRDDLVFHYGLRRPLWSLRDRQALAEQWHVRAVVDDGESDALEVATADVVRVDVDRVLGDGATPRRCRFRSSTWTAPASRCKPPGSPQSDAPHDPSRRSLDWVASQDMEDTEKPRGPWLTTREAHRRLGVDVRSLYRLIDEGQLPAYKDGRELLLAESDVEAYLAQHPPPP